MTGEAAAVIEGMSMTEVNYASAKSAGKESDLDNLLDFLKNELQRRERSQTFATVFDEPPKPSVR